LHYGKPMRKLEICEKQGLTPIAPSWQDRKVVLLHGFVKKTMGTPRKEIEVAVQRMAEVVG
jgi:phage-related protein